MCICWLYAAMILFFLFSFLCIPSSGVATKDPSLSEILNNLPLKQDEGRNFYSVPSDYQDASIQGLKIHISATPSCAATVAQNTLPILLDNKVFFKVLNDNALLEQMNETKQKGKFITVYVGDFMPPSTLLSLLDESLAHLKGVAVPATCEMSWGESGFLSCRHGSYRFRNVLEEHDDVDGFVSYVVSPDNRAQKAEETLTKEDDGWDLCDIKAKNKATLIPIGSGFPDPEHLLCEAFKQARGQ
jgi:hypothetical protein